MTQIEALVILALGDFEDVQDEFRALRQRDVITVATTISKLRASGHIEDDDMGPFSTYPAQDEALSAWKN